MPSDAGHQIDPFTRRTDDFKLEVAEAFDETPSVSFSSQSNGFNAGSTTSVAQGTLGINTSPSARTVAWVAHRAGDSNWSELVQ